MGAVGVMDKLLLYKALKNKSGAEISASGNPVTLSGTLADNPLKDCKIYGWSKQECTTGKNLFDFSRLVSDDVNVMDYDKQTITVPAYTNNTGYNQTLRDLCPDIAPGTYVFSMNRSNPQSGAGSYFLEAAMDFPIKTPIELTDELLDNHIAWYNNPDSEIENVISEIQLEAGDTTTVYEPYTGGQPSPSPDYPQEIISAGMKWSTGAQLYDMDTRLNVEGTEYEKNGTSYTVNIVKASGNLLFGIPFQFSENDVDATVSVSGFSNLTMVGGRIDLLDSKNNVVGTLNADRTEKKLSAKCSQIRFNWSNGGKFIVSDLMLNFGNTALPYEPYTGGVPKLYGDKVNVEVHGKNLFNITTESECDKTGASSTKRIILPGEYIPGLTYTNICANYLDNVFISQERISFLFSGVGYGIGIGIAVKKRKKYVISGQRKNGDTRILFYDKLGGFRGYTNDNPFEVPENAVYTVLLLRKSANTTDAVVFENIQVEEAISPTAYEPYHTPQFLSIQIPTGLPAIPVDSGGNYTDADGQQWIADCIDLKRGKYVQNITTLELDGDEKFRYESGSDTQNILDGLYTVGFARNGTINKTVISNAFSQTTNNWTSQIKNINEKKVSVFTLTNAHWIFFVLDVATFPTKEDFASFLKAKKESGNPVVLYYNLNNPIERDLTQSEIQTYQNLVTYAGTTILENDAECYMEVSSGGGDALRAKKLALLLGD